MIQFVEFLLRERQLKTVPPPPKKLEKNMSIYMVNIMNNGISKYRRVSEAE